MAGRDVGKMGQSEFERLCSSVGLARNVSREDRTGWDYVVEFPLPRSPGQPADMAPPALECRVQVKATDKRRRRWSIPLRNLERLAKSPIPAFICLLELDGEEHAQHVYLVHIGEVIIGRVLKRLRQLERSPSDAAKKPTLSITCDDSHKLLRPTGACLKEAIESYVPEGLEKYSQQKRRLLETLGYENGYGRVSMQVSGHDPVQDLIDLSLGLRKSMRVNEVSWHDTRFNVDCVLPLPSGPAEMSLSPTRLTGIAAFRERRSSPGIEFTASVRASPINRVLPRERISFRIQTKFFDVLIQPIGGKGKFNPVPEVATVAASLAEAQNFLMLLSMIKVRGSQGIWMDVAVNGQCFLPPGQIFIHAKINDLAEELKVVEQALAVARAYVIENKVLVSIEETLRRRALISAFHSVIQGHAGESTATFSVADELPTVQANSGIMFHLRLGLADCVLHCIVGMIGSLERVGDGEYRLVSQEKCLYRCAVTKRGEEMDEGELADCFTGIEDEMNAKGVGPVFIVGGQA